MLLPLLSLLGCSPADQLQSFVEKGKFEKAAYLFARNKEFFRQHKNEVAENLASVAKNLNRPYEPVLQSSINNLQESAWPASESQWAKIKKQNMAAFKLLRRYDSHDILREEAFTSHLRVRLGSFLDEQLASIEQGVETAFLNYNHYEGKSFFDAYPIRVEQRAFMSAHFDEIYALLASVSSVRIEQFARLYQAHNTFSRTRFESLSNLYLSSCLREKADGTHPEFRAIIDSIRTAQDDGFMPSEIPGVTIAFLLVKNQAIHGIESIDFAIEVKRDLPIEYLELDTNNINLEDIASDFDYLVIVHILEAAANREATNRERIASKFQSGTIPIPNPEYDRVKMQIFNCQKTLDRLSSTNSSNPLASFVNGFAIGMANNDFNTLTQRMRNTPAYVDKPIYQDYDFTCWAI